jgi:hypothetical protein
MIVATFLLGALLGGAVAKPVKAETVPGISNIARALERIADSIDEVRRGGLKCHE